MTEAADRGLAVDTRRRLVVNADDFGLNAGVSRGIIEAHVDGIVTSTSLMVRSPHAGHAVALARAHPGLGLGLHLDLGEWIYRGGEWHAAYTVVDTTSADAVACEVEHQFGAFLSLVGRPPDHLDSHQHVHLDEPVAGLVAALGARLGAPVRRANPGIAYCGDFFGQTGRGEPWHHAITVDALADVLGRLGAGVTELCCHPGHAADLDSVYAVEREIELRTLCDGAVRDAVERERIALCRFSDLR